MAGSKTVAILFGEHDLPQGYVISALAEYWREDGLSVHFLSGTKKHVPADLLVLHVDMSLVPNSYMEFAGRYPQTLNLKARDIRKSSFSTLSLSRDSSYEGQVIIKTNLNFGGWPEIQQCRLRTLHDPNPWIKACAWWQGRSLKRSRKQAYRIYSSLSDVPAALWDNPQLLVEKFMPERIDGCYAIRTYHFLGTQESFFLALSENPVVKSRTTLRTMPIEPDGRLGVLRQNLGFDYGKFDYVLVDGNPVLLDLNKTVGLSNLYANDPEVCQARRERAKGIQDFL